VGASMSRNGMVGDIGAIELYQGKPEIKVTSMTQIKGADSQPVAQLD
jgi:hypothetical protein